MRRTGGSTLVEQIVTMVAELTHPRGRVLALVVKGVVADGLVSMATSGTCGAGATIAAAIW